MALTRSISRLDAAYEAGRAFFGQKSDQLRKAQAQRRVYRATFGELSRLSDRDLRDLGIPRNTIKRLAWETAYGS